MSIIRKLFGRIPFAKITYHFFRNIFYKAKNKMSENIINSLVVISGQKCSLFCKNCANFSPYHSKELNFYDADKIIDDLKNITLKARLNIVHFQGGEFFLHKDAAKLLKYANENKKILNVELATNGTIMPNEECLKELRKGIKVRISDYGSVNEKRIKKLIDILKENKIDFWYHSYANGDFSWCDCGERELEKLSFEQAEKNYSSCAFQTCLTLENGLIGRCSRATVAHKIQGFTPAATDLVDVRSPNFKIKDLINYSRGGGGGIVTACFYCNGTSGKHIPAGEQLTPGEIAEIRKGQ